MFTKLSKTLTEAINASPNVDELSRRLGTPRVVPRVVAEYGGVHSATCADYDATQRLLALGVDVGVKILGGNGLEALLATTSHVEPARSVAIVPATARVVRLSVDGGIDVWCLRAQRLLAATRWPGPEEVACVCGMRRTPFVLVGLRRVLSYTGPHTTASAW
jgi:hypothetical protein